MSNEKSVATDPMRYRRQVILPDWDEETQELLTKATVFVAGVGGLGCGAALNLTVAGIGTLKICDMDVVDVTNLNRQFLHKEKNVGDLKTDSGYEELSAINSGIDIIRYNQEINEETVDEMVGDADIVIDCFDNFPGRYTLNKCAIRKGIPMVHAGIWGMEGRLTFLQSPETPCLSCLFPSAPPRAELPVLGAVACSTGAMQAIEAIKYLTGRGKNLKNRMIIMDMSTMRFQELHIKKNPNCPLCSKL